MAGERFKTQVMILHPEQQVLDACRSSFNDDDYSIHLVRSGREALSTLGETPIDLIISAQNLPGMSGAEALREARKRSPKTLGILLAPPGTPTDGLEAIAGSDQMFQVLRGGSSAQEIRRIVETAMGQLKLGALQRSANDSTHAPRTQPAAPGAPVPPSAQAAPTTAAPPRSTAPPPRAPVPPSATPPPRPPSRAPAAAPPAAQGEEIVLEGNTAVRRHTSTVTELPTAGLRTHAGGREIEVLVLSQDASFHRAIEDAASASHAVHHAPTLQEAIDILGLGRVGVLVTDAAVSPRDVEIITTRLREIQPSLVTIVAGRRDDGDELMGLITAGIVYRFLLKPVSAGRARLAIEASVKKSLEYQVTPPPPPKTEIRRTTLMSRVLDDAEEDSGIGRLVAIGAAVFVVIGGLGVWLWQSGGDDETPVAATETEPEPGTVAEPATAPVRNERPSEPPAVVSAEPQPAAVETVTEAADSTRADALRRDAFRALAEGRVAMPPDDNALTLYAEALELAPAAEGLEDDFENAIAEALRLTEEALIAGRLDDAGALLARVRQVQPYQPRLPFLEAQVRREQRRALIDAARARAAADDIDGAMASLDQAAALSAVADPAVSAAREELLAAEDSRELAQLLELAGERVTAGRLVAPSRDNARFYYRAVLARDPENQAAQQGLAFVALSLLDDAEAALGAGRVDEAARLTSQAGASGAAAGAVASLERRIEEIERARAEAAAAEARARAAAEREAAAREAQAAEQTPEAAGALAEAGDETSGGEAGSGAVELSAALNNALPALQQSDLVRTKYVQPQFPRAALRRGRSGWVDLEYTVTEDGKVADIEVLDSEPGSTYVNAAISALSQWEYQPILENGSPVARRANIRVQFALE